MTYTYLITGASRSLGLGYARALLASRPEVRVVAAARNPSSASGLQALANEEANKGRVYLLPLDVVDKENVKKAVKELEESGFLENGGIDALVNNAGVANHQPKPSEILTVPPPAVSMGTSSPTLTSTSGGVLNVTKNFLPLLRKGKGKQIFSLSSTCGSITEFGGNTFATSYCMTKVALNMYKKKLSTELESEGFTVIMFHPGYVKTDMNDGNGEITTEEAVEQALKNVFLKVKPEDNGSFLRYSGGVMPW
ncbi:hypothetical protein JCM8097_005005 [Rhodosporidiobolus ruineniae]